VRAIRAMTSNNIEWGETKYNGKPMERDSFGDITVEGRVIITQIISNAGRGEMRIKF
jgi:hypothetical protein